MKSIKVNKLYQNLDRSPEVGVGSHYFSTLYRYLFTKYRRPSGPIQIDVLDYSKLNDDEYVWFGHSSLLLKKQGKTFLFDPIFGRFSNIVNPFKLTQKQDLETMKLPFIDVLVITHNHEDHLHEKSLQILSKRGLVGQVITPLDNRKYLNKIFKDEQIVEVDWFEVIRIGNVTLQCVPSRHYSWRSVIKCDKFKSLWGGFLIDDVYFSSDSSYYDKQFEMIYENAVIKPVYCFMELGQYNEKSWPNNHMLPEQSLHAFNKVKAKYYIPVHFGRYTLAPHAWHEPVKFLLKQKELNYFIGRMGAIYSFDYVKNNVQHVDESFMEHVRKDATK